MLQRDIFQKGSLNNAVEELSQENFSLMLK
jgi:hypothetical protein